MKYASIAISLVRFIRIVVDLSVSGFYSILAIFSLQHRFSSIISPIEPAAVFAMRGSPTTIGQAFRSGDGDVDPGAIEDEPEAARAVFTVAGAHRKNANG
jgi:hypothetical protein